MLDMEFSYLIVLSEVTGASESSVYVRNQGFNFISPVAIDNGLDKLFIRFRIFVGSIISIDKDAL